MRATCLELPKLGVVCVCVFLSVFGCARNDAKDGEPRDRNVYV